MSEAAHSCIAVDPPWIAFDGIAETYDDSFTRSAVGRAQRRAVWSALDRAFHRGDHVLELNCGTGEDALHLARRGVSVAACDASPGMIAVAHRRKAAEAADLPIRFEVLRTEDLALLRRYLSFDGVFSNFSGLNCVADLQPVARTLSRLVKSGGRVLICLSTRICASEIVYYMARGSARKALRRVHGTAIARLGNHHVDVRYPTIRQIQRAFAPWFVLCDARAIGLFVPPSFAEPWAAAHPRSLRQLERLDRWLRAWPLLRGIGDHVLLEFRKAAQ
ncbi:MAG TPA: class I SAM-dependent methyltransferase [Candidatus Acidoferrales bacterium]|nr:class I SAM-dependent methyltransferase [Candidatus Acidoferrales bacterium]